MLREEDLRIDIGRGCNGGDFLRLVHIPTGISRMHPGPLRDINRKELIAGWCAEVESEIRDKGVQTSSSDHCSET